MFKQRLLAGALSLALFASAAIGLTNHASAAIPNQVTVTASVASVLSLSLDATARDFGTVDILGHHTPADVVDTCSLSNGYRYVTSDVHATVQSSSAYKFGMTYGGGDTSALSSGFEFYVGSGNYGSCLSLSSYVTGTALAAFWGPSLGADLFILASPPVGTTGTVYTQYYALDVTTSADPYSVSAAPLSVVLTYVVVPTV